MNYVVEVEPVDGYEDLVIEMYDNITKTLHDRGVIKKINKKERISEPFFVKIEKRHKEIIK